MKQGNDKSLVPTGETSIIGPNDRERLFQRLEGLKRNNLTERESKEAAEFERVCKESFIQLAWDCFGISLAQIQPLPEKEFRALEKEIWKYAKPRMRLHAALALFPIFGWMWFIEPFFSKGKDQRMPGHMYAQGKN